MHILQAYKFMIEKKKQKKNQQCSLKVTHTEAIDNGEKNYGQQRVLHCPWFESPKLKGEGVSPSVLQLTLVDCGLKQSREERCVCHGRERKRERQ